MFFQMQIIASRLQVVRLLLLFTKFAVFDYLQFKNISKPNLKFLHAHKNSPYGLCPSRLILFAIRTRSRCSLRPYGISKKTADHRTAQTWGGDSLQGSRPDIQNIVKSHPKLEFFDTKVVVLLNFYRKIF